MSFLCGRWNGGFVILFNLQLFPCNHGRLGGLVFLFIFNKILNYHQINFGTLSSKQDVVEAFTLANEGKEIKETAVKCTSSLFNFKVATGTFQSTILECDSCQCWSFFHARPRELGGCDGI